jgi:hypothetical protein
VETTAQLDTGALLPETPKSRAGRRKVAFPAELVPEIRWHLERFAEPGERGLLFVGPRARGAMWHVCGTTTLCEPIRLSLLSGCQGCDQRIYVGAGEGNRTLMTSLEGWGSAIELRPQWSRRLTPGEAATRVAYRLPAAAWSADGRH